MRPALVVYLVAAEGAEISHKLACAKPAACSFSSCACGPRELRVGELKSPIEPRLQAQAKQRKPLP